MPASQTTERLRLGLVGLGRLGRVYARDLATRVPQARLVAVADTDEAARAAVAARSEVPCAHPEPEALLATRRSRRW